MGDDLVPPQDSRISVDSTAITKLDVSSNDEVTLGAAVGGRLGVGVTPVGAVA